MILAKITGHKELIDLPAISYSLEELGGKPKKYFINKEFYYELTLFEAAALQQLGVKLEVYEFSGEFSPELYPSIEKYMKNIDKIPIRLKRTLNEFVAEVGRRLPTKLKCQRQ